VEVASGAMTEPAFPHAGPVVEGTPGDLGPVETADRILLLDVLRGVAIFGILVVNIYFFSCPFLWRIEPPWGLGERVVTWFITFFFQGKFYTMFSFLFGLGLAIQLIRAEERGVDIGPIYRRRLLVLLFIGIVHAVFIWYGDIVHQYALLGFLLMLFRKREPRKLIRPMMIGLAIPIVIFTVLALLLEFGERIPQARQQIQQQQVEQRLRLRTDAAEALEAYSRGTYSQVLQQRLKDLAQIETFAIFFLPHVFAMFLLGLYVGKRGMARDPAAHDPLLRRVWLWGLIIGLIAGVGGIISQETVDPTMPSLPGVFYTALYIVGAPALSFFYMTSIAFALRRPRWVQRLSPIAAVGRMALSNYLLQSILCTTIFYSHGLGLFGKVPPSRGLAIALFVYALQIPLSVWWLGRFRFGPVEWLWRSLTYGKAQAMRLSAARTVMA
jgi:uncharacterized protein